MLDAGVLHLIPDPGDLIGFRLSQGPFLRPGLCHDLIDPGFALLHLRGHGVIVGGVAGKQLIVCFLTQGLLQGCESGQGLVPVSIQLIDDGLHDGGSLPLHIGYNTVINDLSGESDTRQRVIQVAELFDERLHLFTGGIGDGLIEDVNGGYGIRIHRHSHTGDRQGNTGEECGNGAEGGSQSDHSTRDHSEGHDVVIVEPVFQQVLERRCEQGDRPHGCSDGSSHRAEGKSQTSHKEDRSLHHGGEVAGVQPIGPGFERPG